MSSGTVSSLGLGSGVLTQSVIDQLKAADTAVMITPIQNKITTNTQQQQSLTLFQNLMTSFTSSVSSLQNASIYQSRTVTGSTSGASVTASAGADVQNFTISNTKLATTSILQSGSFTDSTNTVATGSGKLDLNINGKDYQIPYTASTTYSDLRSSITDIAGADVTASILQTGTSAYSLVLNSNSTGAAQQITLSDPSGNLNATLSQNSVLKSGDFSSSTTPIASGSGSLNVTIGGVSNSLTYSDTTSLSDLADMINNDSTLGADIMASVVQNSSGAYNLVLTGKDGNQNAISISDQSGNLDTNLTTNSTTSQGSASVIQSASDASFNYNGIPVTRSTNTVTDIASGVTINLLSNDSTDTANISITQNTQPIKDAMNSLVTSYNSLQSQLTTMTQQDTTTGTAGLFSNDNSLNRISRDIKNILTSSDSATGLSLAQYGLSINKDGTISFDSTAFDTQTADNPTAMGDFFGGGTEVKASGKSTTFTGIFNTLYDNLNNLTGTDGTLTTMMSGLTTQATDMQTQETSATALLNARYATLTSKFQAYDSMISSLTQSFSSLAQIIAQSTSSSSSSSSG